MRPTVRLALVLAALGGTTSVPVVAQQGAPSGAGRPAANARSAPPTAEPDLLSPYGARSEPSPAGGSGYRRPPVVTQPVPPNGPRPRGAVFARGVGNYYPTMRPGQSPNRNAINPRSLCVPGRRAMLQLSPNPSR